MKKDLKQIRLTVLPEGVRRLVKVASIILAIIVFLSILGAARRVDDAFAAAFFIALFAYFVPGFIAKSFYWVKNGFGSK